MMYTVAAPRDGLGIADWIVPLLTSVGGAVGGAVATRLIIGPSSPSQKEIEKQLKLQAQLDTQRAIQQQAIQSQQVQEVGSYLVPAVAILGLVMLLR